MEYLRALVHQLKQLESTGKKRTAGVLSRVFLKLAEEEMYDRSRDFFDYEPTVKRPLLDENTQWLEETLQNVKRAPNEQIYLFPYKGWWYAEFTKYNDWNLGLLNGKPNIKKTPYKTHYDAEFVKNQIKDSHPDAMVDYFTTFNEWFREFFEAEEMMPHFDMLF